MATSTSIINAPSIGRVRITKHSKARRITLRIDSDGLPRITIPRYGSTKTAIKFAREKTDWINKHKFTQPHIRSGAKLGDKFVIEIVPEDSTKILGIDSNIVRIPTSISSNHFDASTQSLLSENLIKYLRSHAKSVLPSRLEEQSSTHNIPINRIAVKKMRSRWGSCTSNKNINLSLFLVQLNDRLIDYVLIHELCHIKNMNHSKAFWKSIEEKLPDFKQSRSELKSTRPSLLIS